MARVDKAIAQQRNNIIIEGHFAKKSLEEIREDLHDQMGLTPCDNTIRNIINKHKDGLLRNSIAGHEEKRRDITITFNLPEKVNDYFLEFLKMIDISSLMERMIKYWKYNRPKYLLECVQDDITITEFIRIS